MFAQDKQPFFICNNCALLQQLSHFTRLWVFYHFLFFDFFFLNLQKHQREQAAPQVRNNSIILILHIFRTSNTIFRSLLTDFRFYLSLLRVNWTHHRIITGYRLGVIYLSANPTKTNLVWFVQITSFLMFQQIIQTFATKGLGSLAPSVSLCICLIEHNWQTVKYNESCLCGRKMICLVNEFIWVARKKCPISHGFCKDIHASSIFYEKW